MLSKVFRVSSVRAHSTFISNFEKSIIQLPMREAIRYKHKNIKWTASNFKGYIDAHANGLFECGFFEGDTVAVWLRESPEKHTTMMALLKMGIKVVDMDTKIDNVHDMRKCLEISECKAIFLDPVSETQDNLLLLRKSIPELYEYDDSYGQFFHSKHFPKLIYFIQTGFDAEVGCLTYKSLFLRHPLVSKVDESAEALTDDTPAYVSISKHADGIVRADKELTHGELVNHPTFWFAKNIIDKKFFEF